MTHTRFLLLFLSILIFSCEKKTDKVAELEDEVLAIHDEVMPKSEELITLDKKLSIKLKTLDSLEQEGVSGNATAEQRIKAMELRIRLTEADSLMMDWMHNYTKSDSVKAIGGQAAIDYFELEKTKISSVKEKTLKSIQEADVFLKQ